MSQTQSGSESGEARRAAIETALADYPHVSSDRLAELIHWFRKEASAHDVAMVASNTAIAEPYRLFRADHIDAFTAKDLLRGGLFLFAAVLAVMLIFWRAA